MAKTQSWSFPNIFDISRNKVAVLEDNNSIINRAKLLILTGQNELYNSPDFGVGLKSYLFTYNNANQIAIIRDNILHQLDINEPCVDVQNTSVTQGLLFSEDPSSKIYQDPNTLKLTVALATTFGDSLEVNLDA